MGHAELLNSGACKSGLRWRHAELIGPSIGRRTCCGLVALLSSHTATPRSVRMASTLLWDEKCQRRTADRITATPGLALRSPPMDAARRDRQAHRRVSSRGPRSFSLSRHLASGHLGCGPNTPEAISHRLPCASPHHPRVVARSALHVARARRVGIPRPRLVVHRRSLTSPHLLNGDLA